MRITGPSAAGVPSTLRALGQAGLWFGGNAPMTTWIPAEHQTMKVKGAYAHGPGEYF